MSDPHATSPTKPAGPAARHLNLAYLGFRSARDRREFLFSARWGTESCEYTVWIANAAFAAGRALFQDGPEFDLDLVESTVLDGRTLKLLYVPHPHTGIPEGVGPQRRET